MMNIRYCLMASAAVALSAVPNSHAAYFEQISHNVQFKTESFLSAGALSEAMLMSSGPKQKLASICFITDTEDCQGRGFVSPGDYPDLPKNPDIIDPNPEYRCDKEGYKKLVCNSLQKPDNFCPYDETYFEKCVCRDNLVTCTLPNIGVGATCDGKYDHCCNNSCQSGYDTSSGTCRQASSLVTACGNKCYKILNNTCTSGQISASPETGGYKNKIVSYTECGNPCFQSYNDNCQSGYVKAKESGKCYETSVLYTEYGTTCHKEKPCCDDTCSGYKQNTAPSSSQCPWGSTRTTTGCGSTCYTCTPCNNCNGYNETSSSACPHGADACNNQCLGRTMYKCRPCVPNRCIPGICTTSAEGGDSYYNASECARLFNKTVTKDNCGNSYNLYTSKKLCISSVSTREEIISNVYAGNCNFSLSKNLVFASYQYPWGYACDRPGIINWDVNLNGHTLDARLIATNATTTANTLTLKNGKTEFEGGWYRFKNINLNNVNINIRGGWNNSSSSFGCLNTVNFTNATINQSSSDYIFTLSCIPTNFTINISGYLKINVPNITTKLDYNYGRNHLTANFSSGAYICYNGTKYVPKRSKITEQEIGGNGTSYNSTWNELSVTNTSLFTASGGC